MERAKRILQDFDEFFELDEDTCTIYCRAIGCNFSTSGPDLLNHLESHGVWEEMMTGNIPDQPAYGPERIHQNGLRRRRRGLRHSVPYNNPFLIDTGYADSEDTLLSMMLLIAGRHNEFKRSVKLRVVAMFLCILILFIWIMFPSFCDGLISYAFCYD